MLNLACHHLTVSLCYFLPYTRYCFSTRGTYAPIFSRTQKLWIFVLINFRRLHTNSLFERACRGITALGCIVLTALVCYGRVYLMYHTVGQVIVGGLIGLLAGTFYFFFVHSILTPYVFPKIVSWKISELLLIRDTSLIPNILFFEYTATRQESRARLRKNMKMQ